MWTIRAHSAQNENTLTHYGVPGMKWGVRKDRDTGSKTKRSSHETKSSTVSGSVQKKSVEGGYSNIKRLTNNVKRQVNDNGSFNVTGLNGISRAYFKNEKAYQNWLNGKTNLNSAKGQSFDNSLRTSGPKWDATNNRYTDGPYSISVDSENTANANDEDFVLYFDDPEEYFDALNDIKVQKATQDSVSNYDTTIDDVRKMKTSSPSIKSLVKKGKAAISSAMKKLGKTVSSGADVVKKEITKLADKGKKVLSGIFSVKNSATSTNGYLDDKGNKRRNSK